MLKFTKIYQMGQCMLANCVSTKESVGSQFSLEKMRHARNKTAEAVHIIAGKIQPGMNEHQAKLLALRELKLMGMERIWHGIVIRFGKSTLKTFDEKIDPENTLNSTDIFFVDLGVVWDGHEGDAGDTFVVGHCPERKACAVAAKQIWEDVRDKWLTEGLSGADLYSYADLRAKELGWQMNMNIQGHRVSDFPHAIYQAGELGNFNLCPNTGLWILEIQIIHPSGEYGAFYEDLLERT